MTPLRPHSFGSDSAPSAEAGPDTAAPASAGAGLAGWFANEVHPHDASLRVFVRTSFPWLREVDDLVQEAYLRLLKVRAGRAILYPRAFLFTIARRLAIDSIRSKRRRPELVEVDAVCPSTLLDNAPDSAEALMASQDIALLAEALHALPARCREVLVLRKLDRLSHKEIAARLGVSVATVEAQVHRGMEKLTCYLRRHGAESGRRDISVK